MEYLIKEHTSQLPLVLAMFFTVIMIMVSLTKWALILMFRVEYRSFVADPRNLFIKKLRERQYHWDKKAGRCGLPFLLMITSMTGLMMYGIKVASRVFNPLDELAPIVWGMVVPLFVGVVLLQMLQKCYFTIGLWYERAADTGKINPPPGVKGSSIVIFDDPIPAPIKDIELFVAQLKSGTKG